MKKDILIVGAGAIGGTIATILTYKGYDPHVVVRYPEQKLKAKTEGFEITGYYGDHRVKLNAFLPSDLVYEKYDYILVATKAYDLERAAKVISSHLKQDSLVVSLQNGICEDDLAKIVGKERTVGCVIEWGATLLNYGRFEMTSRGKFIIGMLDGKNDVRIKELKDILENIVPVRISNNIYGNLFSKLIIDSCVTTLGGISGENFGELVSDSRSRDIFINIIKESVEVANAMGIRITPFRGQGDFYWFLKGNHYLARKKRQVLIQIFGYRFRNLVSSTFQSLERKKKTEIDWLNGYISRRAGELELKVPVNDQLIKMIREIESGTREISVTNLDDIILPDFR